MSCMTAMHDFLRVIVSSSRALCCLLSHITSIFSIQCIIINVQCRIIEVLVRVIITPTLTSIILNITKTSCNNNSNYKQLLFIITSNQVADNE